MDYLEAINRRWCSSRALSLYCDFCSIYSPKASCVCSITVFWLNGTGLKRSSRSDADGTGLLAPGRLNRRDTRLVIYSLFVFEARPGMVHAAHLLAPTHWEAGWCEQRLHVTSGASQMGGTVWVAFGLYAENCNKSRVNWRLITWVKQHGAVPWRHCAPPSVWQTSTKPASTNTISSK